MKLKKSYYLLKFSGNIKTEADKKPLTLLSKYNPLDDVTEVMAYVTHGGEYDIVKYVYSDLGKILHIEFFSARKKKQKQ